MTAPLTLSTRQRADGTRVLAAAGEIDMSNADVFRTALAEALPDEGMLVVDLTAVDYLDTAGLTTLFSHAEHIEVVATALLAPVLRVSGLADIVVLHEAGGQNTEAGPASQRRPVQDGSAAGHQSPDQNV